MQNDWAAEHLQTIRTLMERTALYRRALAPIASCAGIIGIAGGIIGAQLKIELPGRFAVYWLAVGIAAVAGAMALVRRQALRNEEKFWSPPTRRVAQAMIPPLLVGLVAGLLVARWSGDFQESFGPVSLSLIVVWTLLYGLALHAAGFFMPRGIKLFGWGFLIAGLAMLGAMMWSNFSASGISPHVLMGAMFGGSHLAYGIYLYFTEPGKNAA
jgi:hypothetical protein